MIGIWTGKCWMDRHYVYPWLSEIFTLILVNYLIIVMRFHWGQISSFKPSRTERWPCNEWRPPLFYPVAQRLKDDILLLAGNRFIREVIKEVFKLGFLFRSQLAKLNVTLINV